MISVKNKFFFTSSNKNSACYLSVDILLRLARVVLLCGEVGGRLGERPQLQQVQEVQVAQPVRAHPVGLLEYGVNAGSEQLQGG